MINQNEAKPRARTAKFELALFEFIEPVVLLYKSTKSYFVGTARPSELGYVNEYFVVSVTPKIMKRYFRQECDLRYLFVSAPGRNFFSVKAEHAFANAVRLVPWTQEISEEVLPDHQFFASSHTREYLPMQAKDTALESLFIDGKWEMEDFGELSTRYRDVYSFEQAVAKMYDASVSKGQKEQIIGAFRNLTLHAGGSYVGFFRDLLKAIPANERYGLASVKYASPGQIDIRGKGEIFDALELRITKIINNPDLRKKYSQLYDLMSQSGLLEVAERSHRPDVDLEQRIESMTKDLLSAIGLNIYDLLVHSFGADTTNAAKIALAVFRRFRSVSAFFEEGRVVFER